MTPAPQPQPHCEHERICKLFIERSEVALKDGYPCMGNHTGCKPCEYDTRSRPAPLPDFTPYIPGKEQSNTYRCCEVCPNVLTKPVFRVNCMQPQHDTAIRNAIFADIEKLKVSTDMGDIVPWCDIQSLHTRGHL